MLDSDPDRRGRTSVCRRITPFLDQRINAKFAKSMSQCLPTGQKRCQSFSHNNTNGFQFSITYFIVVVYNLVY